MSVYLGFIHSRTEWIKHYAGNIADDCVIINTCIDRMTTRPAFSTEAESGLKEAETKIREVLEKIVEARAKFKQIMKESLPT